MEKIHVAFFVLLSILLILITATELWCLYFPLHALKNDLRCLAAEFHDMCKKESLVYWVCGGTLLGSVRHGDIIPHDDDIDLAIKLTDLDKLKRLASEYNLKLAPGVSSGVWQIRKDNLQGFLDIFPVEEHRNRYMFTGRARTLWPKETFDLDDSFETLYPLGKYNSKLKPTTFLDLTLLGPNRESNVDYLTKTYGSSWYIPRQTHFHTMSGFRETFFYSVCISILVLMLLGVHLTVFRRAAINSKLVKTQLGE